LLQALADWTADFDELVMSGQEYIDAGERVVVHIRQQARGHTSGDVLKPAGAPSLRIVYAAAILRRERS
jgi:hypothetical protein